MDKIEFFDWNKIIEEFYIINVEFQNNNNNTKEDFIKINNNFINCVYNNAPSCAKNNIIKLKELLK